MTTTMNAAQTLLAGGDDSHPALVCGSESVTRGELRQAVARAAGAWRSRGLVRGDRVAIKLVDGIDWVVAWLGVIWAGGVAVGVNPRVPAEEWAAILGAADFRFVLADAGGDRAVPLHSWQIEHDTWRSEAAAAAPIEPLPMQTEEPAFWVHSSGTSGKPKAVMHAQRAVLEIERVGRERLGLVPADRILASSKLFFAYPLTNALLAGLKIGATVILDPQWPSAENVLASTLVQRPTVLFSVPSLYRNLLKDGLAPQLAQAGVRLYVSAGEALPASLREEWKRQTGCTIVNGYGASETLVLALVDVDDWRGLQVSPGLSVRALDETPPGVPCRLLIHGPMIALGYWQRPDAQAEHFRDGGFSPSDLFEPGDAGSWRFAGREDSLVKVHGRWVDLIELEQRIALACPALAETAAVSVPDADGVEAVALFYVALPGAPALDTTSLREHADRLPPFQRPRWLHAVETLPRSATGKLMRRRLRDLHTTLAEQAVEVVQHDPH
ncbi:MAG TPA: AMP-binding protein [Ideonella sp.]|nr:AMP-binding protein [Ideonella sp.]